MYKPQQLLLCVFNCKYSIFGALAGLAAGAIGGSSLAGGLSSAYSAVNRFISSPSFSAYSNYRLLKRQENREDTAYQRQIGDLRSAGLNPTLGITKGGGGAQANAAKEYVASQTALNNASAFKLYKEASNIEQDTAKKYEETLHEKYKTRLTDTLNQKTSGEVDKIAQEVSNLHQQYKKLTHEISTAKSEAIKRKAQATIETMHADLAKSLGVSLQTIDRIIAAVGSVGLFRIVREFKETMKSKKGSKKKVSSKMFDIKKWEKQQYKEWKPSDARRY